MNNPITATPAEPADYADWLASIKTRVQSARSRAALAANAELVGLYWHIGNDILQRQQAARWGDKVLQRLSSDLRTAFPEMKGFSLANLKFMRAFAQAWPDAAIGQQAVSQLPWGHNVLLLTRLKESALRLRYAEQAIADGWSRSTLEANLRDQLLERQGRAVTNFEARLPSPHSQLAHATLKDPYLFDFLGLGNQARELLLCKTRKRTVAEYALSGIDKPIGVAEYRLLRDLPQSLTTSLPSVAQLESELGMVEGEPRDKPKRLRRKKGEAQ